MVKERLRSLHLSCEGQNIVIIYRNLLCIEQPIILSDGYYKECGIVAAVLKIWVFLWDISILLLLLRIWLYYSNHKALGILLAWAENSLDFCTPSVLLSTTKSCCGSSS